jgi:hypothetical protein
MKEGLVSRMKQEKASFVEAQLQRDEAGSTLQDEPGEIRGSCQGRQEG